MKNLLYILGSTLLKKVLLPPPGQSFSSPVQAFPKFNIPYLSDIARGYAIAAAFALIFSLFLVAGISMALFSAAQSFDLFGVFVPGAVFYTGVGLAVLSLVVIAACFVSVRNNKVLKEKIYIIEEEKEAIRSPLDYLNLVQPFMHGLMNGWRKERDKKYYAKAQTEPFPADEDLGRASRDNRDNVAEFRVR